jgi:hypothetical protein
VNQEQVDPASILLEAELIDSLDEVRVRLVGVVSLGGEENLGGDEDIGATARGRGIGHGGTDLGFVVVVAGRVDVLKRERGEEDKERVSKGRSRLEEGMKDGAQRTPISDLESGGDGLGADVIGGLVD